MNTAAYANLGNQWFQTIYEHAPTGIAIIDIQGTCVHCNPAYRALLGLREDEFQQLKLRELVHLDDLEAITAEFHRLLGGEIASFEIEIRYLRKEGSAVWVRNSVSCFPDTNEKPAQFMLFATDITERKQVELALIETNERLKRVLEIETVGVMFWDLSTGRMTDANHTFLELMGYSRHDLEAGELTWQKLTPPEYLEISQAEVRKFSKTGHVGPYEKEYFHKDGTRQWFVFAGSSLGGNTCVEFCVDISARKKIEAELEKTNATLQEAQQIAHMGSFEYIAATRSTVWSAEVFRIYGLDSAGPSPSYEDMLQHCIHPDDAGALNESFTEAVQNISLFGMEHRIVRPDGGIRWVFSRARPYLDDQGTLVRFVGTVLDYTDQKVIEMALLDSEQRWQFALEGAGDGLWDWNAATNKVFFSSQWKKMLGFSDDDIGDSLDEWDQRVHPDDKAAVYVEIDKLFAREIPIYSSEHRVLCKNGRYKWILDRGKVISWASDGKPLRVIGMHTDIDARKQTELELQKIRDALEQSEYRFQSAMEAADEGIWDWQMDNNQVYYSPGFATMLGYEAGHFSGHLSTWIGLLHPSEGEAMVMNIREQLKAKGHFALEFRLRARDGNYRWILSRGKVLEYDAIGLPKRAIGTHVDITELKEARNAAELHARIKSDFLANMSHEIRTPLNAILGFCQLLKRCQLDSDSQLFVKKIDNSGRVLLSLVNDILDYSRIESGQFHIEQTPFSLNEMLDDIAAIMASSSADKALEMVITSTSNINGLIGDRKRIQQVLTNLVSNAIKFTEHGTVEVKIDVLNETPDRLQIRFTVCDSGIGIAQDKQSEIFSAFTQADTSISRRFGGTGLGLAISKQLVDLMGGTLSLRSQIDQGSEFSFELPLKRTQTISPITPNHGDLKILIVDDNENARRALIRMTEALGWQANVLDLVECDLNQSVIDQVNQNHYEVLLIDWPMAELNVLEIAEALHGHDKHPTTIKIIIMVAIADHERVVAAPEYAWIDSLLVKPVTPSSLYNSINALLLSHDNQMPTSLTTLNQEPINRLAGVRVLVVDDNEINRDLAQRVLASEGCTVASVENGLEAYEWLKNHPNLVDIILMDLQMPVMNGYQATQLILSEPCWQNLPIIALSAGTFKEDIELAQAAGMVDFLPKPLNIDDMVDKIRKQINHSSSINPSSTEAVASHVDINPPSTSPNGVKTDLDIDFVLGLSIWRDLDVYFKYLNKFLDTYQTVHEEFTQLNHLGDFDQALKLAHKIKGGAASMAFPKITYFAQAIEQDLKSGSFNQALIESLHQSIDDAKVYLDIFNTLLDEPSSSVDLLLKLISDNEKNVPAIASQQLEALQRRILEKKV